MVGKHILVTGKVQGVGFRFFAKTKADLLGLRGWVRNRDSGEVEIKVAGPEKSISSYLEALKLGPGHAKVDNLDVRNIEISEISIQNGFDIRF